jgi:CRISPR-associated protein Cas5 subtype I-B
MRGAMISLRGNWGHFKKPETNNNPLTHDFITKTALIGMIGAVLGIERSAMKPLFPQLSEDLLYGVRVRGRVKKESWGFTLRSLDDAFKKAPGQMEFLRNPDFAVVLGLANERSASEFEKFLDAVQRSESCFTPVFGLHNCPAEIENLGIGKFSSEMGAFSTAGFVTRQHEINLQEVSSMRIGFERVPTFQNDDFWNLPDRYKEVVYPSEGHTLSCNGEFYNFSFDNSQWVMI